MDVGAADREEWREHLTSRLLNTANDQGMWKAVAKQQREASATLQAARTRYLEQQLVLQAIEDLLLDVHTLLGNDDVSTNTAAQDAAGPSGGGNSSGADEGDGRQAADNALMAAGFQCSSDTYASLNRHLQAAQALQRLQMPTHQPTEQRKDALKDIHPERDGTLEDVLGVSAEALRQQHLPSKKRAQRYHAGVLGELEQRLCDQTDTLVRQLGASAGTHTPAPSTPASPAAASLHIASLSVSPAHKRASPAAAASPGSVVSSDASTHVLQLVAARCAGLEALEQSNAELLQVHVGEAGRHLGRLQDMQRLLVELVEGCMLDKQRRIDEMHCQWLITHVRTLHSKLRVLEGQFQASAYTKDTIPALQVIHDLLERQTADTQAALEQTSAQLLAYEECGPEFMALVAEYAAVKEEMRRVDHALHKFTELEQELAA